MAKKQADYQPQKKVNASGCLWVLLGLFVVMGLVAWLAIVQPIQSIRGIINIVNSEILGRGKDNAIIEQDFRTIDSLETIITRLQRNQIDFDEQIKALNDSLQKQQSELIDNENEIQELKKQTSKKAAAVRNYSNDQLYRALSDRYKR